MAEGLLFEQTYPGSPSAFTNNYTSSFTITTGDYVLMYSNVNNGRASDNWNAVRAGSKNGASVATITSGAIAENVSKVVVNFTQATAAKTNSLSLKVASDTTFADATVVNATIAVGEVAFEIAEPAANKCYRIVIDMAQGSANGFNRWDKIQFISPDGGAPIVPIEYDTLSVAQAVDTAALLADNAQSQKFYIEGYAVNVAEYSTLYNNQDFYLVDDAAAPDSVLQVFRATPTKAGKAYPVLAGDQLRILGALKKYVKDGKTQLEIVDSSIEFVNEVEGDRTIPEPEVDTITVVRALQIGDSIGQGKTTAGQYVINGYVTALTDNKGVANADGGWAQYGNQCMWVADTYDSTAVTKTTAFFVYQGVAPEQVIKGAKIRFTCAIKNYNGMIETAVSKGAITILEQGQDSAVVPPTQETMDTITVARAMEIGSALAQGATTDSTYVIAGYVSSIEQYFDSTYKNETFWMVDTMGQRAATTAAGAFQVYRGVPTPAQEIGIDAFVYVTSKIQNYNGKIETLQGAAVNVVTPGTIEEVASITVDSALAIGKALADGGISDLRYEITGYISNVYTFYNPDFGNETVWITDDPNSTSVDKANAFEIYRGKPNTKAEAGWGAKIKVVCKIKNYQGTIENDGSNIAFEVLEPSTFVPDTITVEDAIAMTSELADGAKLPTYSVVKGFVRAVTGAYDSKNNNATFSIADYATGTASMADAYRTTILKADAEKVAVGSYAVVTGYLMKKGGATQLAQGSITAFEEAPVYETIYATPSEALAAGQALEDNKRTQNVYVVTGYVARANEYDPEDDDFQTFWLADEKGGEAVFKALNAKVTGDGVKVGDKVALTGNVFKYVAGEDVSVYIEQGGVEIIPEEGIENIVLTEQAQKVVVDGVMYIIRDGKMFNAQGVQVR